MNVELTPDDHELAAWLAARTRTEEKQVAAELQIGDRRRAFVAAELVEAGFTGEELLERLRQLTGVDAETARALVAGRVEPDREAARAEVGSRDARLAENEILFRQLNERLASAGADSALAELELVCECSDRDCARVLTIDVAEYEWLRQNPHRFAVLPGHEAPALEDVVERHERFVIVEKHAGTQEQVEAADPRRTT